MSLRDHTPRIPFDDDATQVLRRAGHAAAGRPVGPDDLRAALAQPDTTTLPSVTLHLDPICRGVLQRAMSAATAANAAFVGREHLECACLEESALAAGLMLERLWFARWRIERLYGHAPAQRCIPADSGVA